MGFAAAAIAAFDPAALASGSQSGAILWSLAISAALFAAGMGSGFQCSKDFLLLAAILAAAPADDNCTPPVEGYDGRSWALAYLRDVAAPGGYLH